MFDENWTALDQEDADLGAAIIAAQSSPGVFTTMSASLDDVIAGVNNIGKTAIDFIHARDLYRLDRVRADAELTAAKNARDALAGVTGGSLFNVAMLGLTAAGVYLAYQALTKQ